jgi:hypothetical protein
MKKAWNLVIAEIKTCDAVLEVVDARCPNETRSKKLESILQKMDKPFWLVLNKVDLVPKTFADKAKSILKESCNAVDVVFISAKKFYGYNILRRSIKEFFGKDRKVKLSVLGFPNVGKSSLINALAKQSKVSVAPRPGHTKGKQWIKVSSTIRVSDTPGILPKEFAAEIWRKILFPEDVEDAAYLLLEKIKNAEGSNFEILYEALPEPCEDTLVHIAKKFNYLKAGGEFDISRAAKKIVDDWNSGKLTAWWI